MPLHTSASAVMLWRSLRLGPLHFTPYGLAATAGLVAAMALARRCAARSGSDPEVIWDAGLFAIFSCFAASRLLLALASPAAFARYPLLLLGRPSLTFGGMALAALASGVYLRRKRLPLLRTLDTFAAPAALLAAFLELGHWADGSEAGTSTRLPWGVAVDGVSSLRVHPVALYGMVTSFALALWLWTALPPVSSGGPRQAAQQDTVLQGLTPFPGKATSLGFLAGGLAAFVLDMLSVPPAGTFGWLEPGQWLALTIMLTGALVWGLRPLGSPRTSMPQKVSTPTRSPLHMEVH